MNSASEQRYSTKELCALLHISNRRVSDYVNGRVWTNAQRWKYYEAPLLLEEKDYVTVIENGRTKRYFFESAVEKIRAKQS